MRCSRKQETYNWRSVSVVLVLNWNKKTIVAIEIAWNLRTWTEGFSLFLFSQRGVNGHVPVLIAVSAMCLLLSQQKSLVSLKKFTIPPSLRNKSKIKFTIFNSERNVNYKLCTYSLENLNLLIRMFLDDCLAKILVFDPSIETCHIGIIEAPLACHLPLSWAHWGLTKGSFVILAWEVRVFCRYVTCVCLIIEDLVFFELVLLVYVRRKIRIQIFDNPASYIIAI